MIGLFALNFHMSPQEVLNMTMQNVMMYNAVIPSYRTDKDKSNKKIKVTKDNRAEVDRILGL